uniref:Uncharacterized protein n=1 Tax=Chrysotila carterae TaxID=13221 RepID=A0A7S4BL89_CHRCT|mmetsp:Transcript_33322/g.73163  ORF Transcript_33322/g.73163 Transcript_33322/m.73163 type:complete len:367 (+) Transcript_33322:176-1276(+)
MPEVVYAYATSHTPSQQSASRGANGEQYFNNFGPPRAGQQGGIASSKYIVATNENASIGSRPREPENSPNIEKAMSEAVAMKAQAEADAKAAEERRKAERAKEAERSRAAAEEQMRRAAAQAKERAELEARIRREVEVSVRREVEAAVKAEADARVEGIVREATRYDAQVLGASERLAAAERAVAAAERAREAEMQTRVTAQLERKAETKARLEAEAERKAEVAARLKAEDSLQRCERALGLERSRRRDEIAEANETIGHLDARLMLLEKQLDNLKGNQAVLRRSTLPELKQAEADVSSALSRIKAEIKARAAREEEMKQYQERLNKPKEAPATAAMPNDKLKDKKSEEMADSDTDDDHDDDDDDE